MDEPARKMQEAVQQFSCGEWNLQMEALNTIRSLSLFHSELLKGQPGGVSQLHAITLQVLALCDSLRSTLAKSALMCVEGTSNWHAHDNPCNSNCVQQQLCTTATVYNSNCVQQQLCSCI